MPVDPSSGDNSCGPDNSLNIIHEKLENLEVQGTSSSIVTATAVSIDDTNSVGPVKGMEMSKRLTFSQTTTCLKYLIDTGIVTIHPISSLITSGDGARWSRYAGGGDKSYMHHHAASISNFFARMGLLLGR